MVTTKKPIIKNVIIKPTERILFKAKAPMVVIHAAITPLKSSLQLSLSVKDGRYFFTPTKSKAVTNSIDILVASATPATPINLDNVMLSIIFNTIASLWQRCVFLQIAQRTRVFPEYFLHFIDL